MRRALIGLLITCLIPGARMSAEELQVPRSAIERGLEWRGAVLEEKDYTLWDVSPIRGDDGKVHLFVGRWPEKNVDPAWRKSSEIAHYVGDGPEGPFRFHDVVLQGTGRDTWDKYAPHNPEVRRIGDDYVLTYIANSDFHQPPHPRNQRIGMAVSKSLDGPWRKVGREGLILEPSPDKDHWTHGSQVVNPTLLKVGARFHLYFKSLCQGQKGTVYGVAVSDHLEGPYQITGGPLTTKGVMIEDGFAFEWQGRICLISTDNHGGVTGVRGGGALWVSDNGLLFNPAWTQSAYQRIPAYYHDYDATKVKRIYGSDPKLERPKLLMENGAPAWLYAPSGLNVTGGERTVIHALKVNLKPGDGPLPGRTRIACLGDSITFGTGADRPETESYPARLAGLMGPDFEIRNFGVGGTTLMAAGDTPYWTRKEFKAAQEFRPDIAILMFGTNDTCGPPRNNWEKSAGFSKDADEMIGIFKRTGARVIISLPPPMLPGTPGLKPERRVDLTERAARLEQVRLWWREAAAKHGAGIVDLGGTLEADREHVTDGVHPTTMGYARIADRIAGALKGSPPPAKAPAVDEKGDNAELLFRMVDPERNPFPKTPRRDLSVNIGGGKGVVISPHWVLTAAHCISSRRGDSVNMNYVDDSGKKVTLASDKVIRHGSTDLALVRLKSPANGRSPLLLLKDGFPVSRKGQPPYRLAKIAGNGVWEDIPARVSPKSDGMRFYVSEDEREGKAGTSGSPWVMRSPLVGDVLVGITHGTGRIPQVGKVCGWIEETVNSMSADRILWATPGQALPTPPVSGARNEENHQ